MKSLEYSWLEFLIASDSFVMLTPLPNSAMMRCAGLLASGHTLHILPVFKPYSFAQCSHSLNSFVGTIIEMRPDEVNSEAAFSRKRFAGRASVCLVYLRFGSDGFTPLLKNGGLEIIRSNDSLEDHSRKSLHETLSRSGHGEAWKLIRESAQLPSSISSEWMVAVWFLWAIINEMTPEPQPTSSIRLPNGLAHAASKHPSVFTRIAQRSWCTRNCLKRNDFAGIVLII